MPYFSCYPYIFLSFSFVEVTLICFCSHSFSLSYFFCFIFNWQFWMSHFYFPHYSLSYPLFGSSLIISTLNLWFFHESRYTLISLHTLGTSLHYQIIGYLVWMLELISWSGCISMSLLEPTFNIHSTYSCKHFLRTRYDSSLAIMFHFVCFHTLYKLRHMPVQHNQSLWRKEHRQENHQERIVSWTTQTSP